MSKAAMTLILVIFVAGFSVTSSYSMWYKELQLNGTINTGSVDWEFIGSPGCIDDGLDWNGNYSPSWDYYLVDKDVGSCSGTYVDDHTMEFTIDNAYPWYFEEISMHAVITGTVPIKIWKVVVDGITIYETNKSETLMLDLDNDGLYDLALKWNDNLGGQFHPGDTIELSFWIVVLQDAPQNSSLTLTIQVYAVQWNEYSIPA